jgi:hypothetical protein
MRGIIRSLASPATVLAMLALFIAAGGTGYAVTKLPKNSVGTQQIKSKAVTTPKLAADASARIAGLTYKKYTFVAPAHVAQVVTVPCPQGLTAIGGGLESPHELGTVLLDGHPLGSAWETSIGNGADVGQSVSAYAICAKVEGGAAKPASVRGTTATRRSFEFPEAR